MKRRFVLKGLTLFSILLSKGNMAYGENMLEEIKTFKVEDFPVAFKTMIDKHLSVHKINNYDGTFQPFIRIYNEDEKDDFLIEISCFESDFFTDPLSLGTVIGSISHFKNLDFDKLKTNFGHALVTYNLSKEKGSSGKIYIFKYYNNFVIINIICSNWANDRYQLYEKKIIRNFQFDKLNEQQEFESRKLNEKTSILLPFDWQVDEVTVKAREIHDPKNRMTAAYFFQHKKRNNSLPNILVAHYQDSVDSSEYLIDNFKNVVAVEWEKQTKGTLGEWELLKYREKPGGNLNMLTLEIAANSGKEEILPIQIRVSIFRSKVTFGCYMLYSTSATVKDSRINSINNSEILSSWSALDVMGSSMELLLGQNLTNGIKDYPEMFDYRYR